MMKQLALDIGVASPATLDSFHPAANEAAWKHVQLWARSPTRSPVPTYLWGNSGSGKTHLLKAVEHALREQGAIVGWLDASVAEPPPFREDWAVVLFDDVERYTAVQQHAAFSWFVQAQTMHRGVLAAGALPPADLPLRDDLRTRLAWGHVFQLRVMSEPERRAVLRQAADARGIFLSDDVMDFILARFSRDLDSLMQLLQHLDAYALRAQRGVTIPLIKSMLEEAE